MENRKKTTVTTGEILYWLFFGSLLFAKGIGLYDGQAIFKLVLVFAGACFLFKLAIEKYTLAEMLRVIGVIAFTAATYLISGEKGLLLYGMMMAGMKYVNVKRLFTMGTILWTIAFFCIIVSSLFHMEDTVYKVHEKLGLGHIFRWSLGYPHPNVLQISYLILAIFIIYCLGEHFRIRHAIYLLAGGLWVFLYSISYTGIAVLFCLLSGRIYLYFRKKLNMVEKVLLQMILPLCVTASLIAPVALKGRAFEIVNKLLSTRLLLGKLYLIPENISLFGKRYAEISNEVLTLDNSYLFAFITYGIIPFTFLVAATFYMLHAYLKKDRYLEVLIMVTIVVGGLTEPFLYNTSFKNLSFLFMGSLMFEMESNGKLRSILPEKWTGSFNREFLIPQTEGCKIKEKAYQIIKPVFCKVICGVAGAGLLFLTVNVAVSYPQGYVVSRKDCSGLTEEKHFYQEKSTDYDDYTKMKSFENGDEVEFFSGNIVKMERFRNSISGIIFGFMVGYVFMAEVSIIKNKNKKLMGNNRKDNQC